MSMVEDVRQVIQDFIAPELRAITARLDAQEKVSEARHKELQIVMDSRFKEVDSRIESRFNQIDSRFKEIDSRFKEIDSKIDSRFNEVSIRLQSLQETVDRNDSAQKLLITKLTQDFQFDKRLTEIERVMRLNQSTAA